MTPRVDMEGLEDMDSIAECVLEIQTSNYSRFPVYHENLDDIQGVVHVKDLLAQMSAQAQNQPVIKAAKPVPFVPESMPINDLLQLLRTEKAQLAVVVDEYGSVEGIVTLEDVLEEIVGEIRDESDLPVEEFQDKTDGTLIVRGSVDMRKLCSRLGITWDPELEVSTISGLVTEILERIPVVGDTVDWDGYRIEVLRADRRRAKLLSIRERPEDELPAR